MLSTLPMLVSPGSTGTTPTLILLRSMQSIISCMLKLSTSVTVCFTIRERTCMSASSSFTFLSYLAFSESIASMTFPKCVRISILFSVIIYPEMRVHNHIQSVPVRLTKIPYITFCSSLVHAIPSSPCP